MIKFFGWAAAIIGVAALAGFLVILVAAWLNNPR